MTYIRGSVADLDGSKLADAVAPMLNLDILDLVSCAEDDSRPLVLRGFGDLNAGDLNAGDLNVTFCLL